MVALGLFLLLIAGAVTVGMVLQNTDASSASVFGQAVNGTLGGLFLAGVITGAVALLGVTLIIGGLARRRARRVGLKRQVREAHGERETLAEENARLQGELDATRSGSNAYPDNAGTVAGRHADETDPATSERPGLFRR